MKIYHEINSEEMLFRRMVWQKGEMSFHWHEKVEIVRCTDGEFDALVDGVNCKVKKGDIVVVSERVIHKFTVTTDCAYVRLAQFAYKVLLNHNSDPTHVKLHITAEEIANVENLGQSIEDILSIMENTSPDPGGNDKFAECIYAGLYFLLGRYFPTPHYTKTKKKEKQDFYETVKYVNEHFKEDITVQSIAETLYMDRGRLSRLFLKYSGISLKDYINTLRLAEAVRLIDSGDKITDAAMKSGFQTVRTFNNVCKKHIKEK